MAQVGIMFSHSDGSMQGQLKTLTLSLDFYLYPNEKGGEHHFNVLAGANIPIGRAWQKTIMNGDQRGQVYYSIQMDDMSFPDTINVAAFPSRGGPDNEYELQWNRPKQGNGTRRGNSQNGLSTGTGMASMGNGNDAPPPASESDYYQHHDPSV